MGSLISSRQDYPNLLQCRIWIQAQGTRSFCDLSVLEQAGIQGSVLTYIAIADAMVNKKAESLRSRKKLFLSKPYKPNGNSLSKLIKYIKLSKLIKYNSNNFLPCLRQVSSLSRQSPLHIQLSPYPREPL